MKKIEAIVRSEKLSDVCTALAALDVVGMTVTAAKGRGRQKGISVEWRMGEYRIELLPKVMVMVVVHDDKYRAVVDAVMEGAWTGAVGDGKIFVSTVEEVFRVRTKETGEAVL